MPVPEERPPFFPWPQFGYFIIAVLLGMLIAELARRWNFTLFPIPIVGKFE